MNPDLRIRQVELGDDSITIQWSDGHRGQYRARDLRLNCSCAQCVEEWTRRKLLDPATVPANIRAEDYLLVGRYAIQFLWSDAHFTGIYPFDVLRALCQCQECSAARATRRPEG